MTEMLELNEEQFFEIDSFEEFDDIEFDAQHCSHDMMITFNNSHKKISALDYFEQSKSIENIRFELPDLQSKIASIILNLEKNHLDEIVVMHSTIESFTKFLGQFLEFCELLTSLNLLENILNNPQLKTINDQSKQFIAHYLIAIWKDLEEWLLHVFVKKDAVDVFYINASSLNSCIQLESYIKKHI